MKAICETTDKETMKMVKFYPVENKYDMRKCTVGFKFIPDFRPVMDENYNWITMEDGELKREIFIGEESHNKLIIYPRLAGQCATLNEILIALYFDFGEEFSFGDQLEEWGRLSHKNRSYYWNVEKKRFSGYDEYRIHESEDEIDREFGLAGRVTATFQMSPHDKVNCGNSLELNVADWYVFMNTIPHKSLKELEKQYKEEYACVKELFPVKAKWYSPGEDPWYKEIRVTI